MDFIKYTFNEDEWTLYLIEDDDEVLSDTDTEAEVMHEKKEIYFRKSDLRLNVVLHELWHVYFGYCYLTDASISCHQAEEISASLFADKGEKVLEKSRDIYRQLKKLRDNKGE